MISTTYRVEIAQINGSGDAAGFIDPTTVEEYMAKGEDAGTFEQHTDKVRANYRYLHLVQSVQSMGNLYFTDVVAAGGSITTAPTKLEFTLVVERGDGMLLTPDDTDPSIDIEGVDAIKRCIARSLTHKRDELLRDVLDWTETTAPQNGVESTSIARVGPRVVYIKVDELVADIAAGESSVTVTKI